MGATHFCLLAREKPFIYSNQVQRHGHSDTRYEETLAASETVGREKEKAEGRKHLDEAVHPCCEKGRILLCDSHVQEDLWCIVVLRVVNSQYFICGGVLSVRYGYTRVFVPVNCWQTIRPTEMSARLRFPGTTHISLKSVHQVASPTRRLSMSSCSAMSRSSPMTYSWSLRRLQVLPINEKFTTLRMETTDLDNFDKTQAAFSHWPFRTHHLGLSSFNNGPSMRARK